MAPNVIFVGWNRAIPGRERITGEHFQEFNQYLSKLKEEIWHETTSAHPQRGQDCSREDCR